MSVDDDMSDSGSSSSTSSRPTTGAGTNPDDAGAEAGRAARPVAAARAGAGRGSVENAPGGDGSPPLPPHFRPPSASAGEEEQGQGTEAAKGGAWASSKLADLEDGDPPPSVPCHEASLDVRGSLSEAANKGNDDAPAGAPIVAPPPDDEPRRTAALPTPPPRPAPGPAIVRSPRYRRRAAPPIQLEATLVEDGRSDEGATVYSAVHITPSRWERHKWPIVAVFILVVAALVAALTIQGGGGDVQVRADPSPPRGSDDVRAPFGDAATTPPAGPEPTNGPTEPPYASPATTPPSGRPTEVPSVDATTSMRDALAAGWVQRGDDLDGEAVGDRAGSSVDLSGDGTVLAVGAYAHDAGGRPDAGRVRVHAWDASAALWIRRGDDLDGASAGDWLGLGVVLSRDGLVLAVKGRRSDGAGVRAVRVRVYAWDALAAAWVRRGNDLGVEEAVREVGYHAGRSMALSGDGAVLAVGSPSNDAAGDAAGRVRVYAWDGAAAAWVRRGGDVDGEAAGDKAGWSVALSNDGLVLAAGAKYNDGAGAGEDAGHVRVHEWDAAAAAWVQRGDDVDGEADGDNAGYAVALSGDGAVLAVGAEYNGGAGTRAGHVRVFDWDAPAAAWVQRGDDLDGEAVGDQAGSAVALSDDGAVVAVGARYNDGGGDKAGHVRVHEWNAAAAAWVRRGDDVDGEAACAQSAGSLALSSDGAVLAVGSPFNLGPVHVGHARVYTWEEASEA